MKRCIPHLAITMALLSFAFGQSATQQESQNTKSEEVRKAIEKYRTALLQRDIPALEKIWADDYVFMNASGDVLTKAQRLANVKSGATTLDSIKEEEEIIVRCLSKQRRGDESGDDQGTVRRSIYKRPVPQHPRLGKRLDGLAISF